MLLGWRHNCRFISPIFIYWTQDAASILDALSLVGWMDGDLISGSSILQKKIAPKRFFESLLVSFLG
jgi:hypothetical protein